MARLAFEAEVVQEVVEELVHGSLGVYLQADGALEYLLGFHLRILLELCLRKVLQTCHTSSRLAASTLKYVIFSVETHRALKVLHDVFQLRLFVEIIFV